MMVPEFKWPGALEIPLLLLFMFGVMLVLFLLAAAAGDDAMHGRANQEAETGQEERVISGGSNS